jgi:uncharacterized protein YwqG
MNFFKKLFSGSSSDKNSKPENSNGNANALKKLEAMVEPLLRKATLINVQIPSTAPETSQFKSYFGGQPYFEEGASWPQSASGVALDFVFQVVNDGSVELPTSIGLIQFFYDFEESPWDTDNDGWHVKIYKSPDTSKKITLENPTDATVAYCEILFEPIASLPDWEGLDLVGDDIAQLCEKINDDEPWEPYDAVVMKFTGSADYQSQLGGYPKWVQGESTPVNNKGENVKLLFQIDSEDNAGLMWGDVGLIYVFYDEVEDRLWFELQCH